MPGMLEEGRSMVDFALLILRLTLGGLMAGHGAQKLFGSFGGPGPEGTAGILSLLVFVGMEGAGWPAGGAGRVRRGAQPARDGAAPPRPRAAARALGAAARSPRAAR